MRFSFRGPRRVWRQQASQAVGEVGDDGGAGEDVFVTELLFDDSSDDHAVVDHALGLDHIAAQVVDADRATSARRDISERCFRCGESAVEVCVQSGDADRQTRLIRTDDQIGLDLNLCG